ncbi:MAG: hypothetical protein CL988_04745 [Euryarchaeota archaeon]|nr:hypothetical protein [Euryarchaeota archaeon]|tara:strand:+ start:1569 stop:2270 length:702 start_codon:yes stop_codon:yes gene_type:complete
MNISDVDAIEQLSTTLSSSQTIHIFGAGLKKDKPAHTAVHELKRRGWAVAPVHPNDAGATIDGFPIRPNLDDGLTPEVVVLFLAPERARKVVKNLILRFEKKNFPLVWFQHGAEDDASIEALNEMGVTYVSKDCIVRYSERHNLQCSNSPLPQQWCIQIASNSGDGCSEWSVHDSDSVALEKPKNALEWVGSLDDLRHSHHTIANYIRSLKKPNESLLEASIRLSGNMESLRR